MKGKSSFMNIYSVVRAASSSSSALLCHSISYNRPFRASSTLRAASPALYPPFDMHMRFPSASSNLSSWASHAQGQWWGKCTQARVSGQRYLSQMAVFIFQVIMCLNFSETEWKENGRYTLIVAAAVVTCIAGVVLRLLLLWVLMAAEHLVKEAELGVG